MQHDLFFSLDSSLSVPAGSGGLLIRDVTGQYRVAEADEVLLAAQRLLAAQARGSDLMDSPAVVKEFLRSRLGHLTHEVFAVMHLDSLVEATPLQRENFMQLLQKYSPILMPVGSRPGEIASMPRRSTIAEAQAGGFVLWETKKTAARDARREIEPGLTFIANTVLSPNPKPTVTHPLNGASHGPVAR